MQLDFAGQTILVTGAAQGIGRAIAAGFKAAGGQVVAVDIDRAGVESFAAQSGMTGHAADLGDRAAVAALVAEVTATHGAVDCLVHAAGGVRGQVAQPLETIDETGWRAIFAANVDAAMWLAQAVAPGMKQRGRGRIVTISSGAGLRPSLTGIQAYASAKHALVGLTRQLSWELAPHGITVNSVAPGFVPSNPSSIRQWESYSPQRQAEILGSIHTKRLGTAQDIANAVLFLASAQASWISGQILSVDGGRS